MPKRAGSIPARRTSDPIATMIHLVHFALENLVILGFLGFLLIVIPIMGIMAAHERGR